MTALAGCSTISKPPQPIEPPPNPCQHAPAVDALTLRDIEWLEARDALGRIVFGLSAQDYADMSVNMAAIQRTLEQRKSQVGYYRACIAGLDAVAKPAPKQSPWWKFWSRDGEEAR